MWDPLSSRVGVSALLVLAACSGPQMPAPTPSGDVTESFAPGRTGEVRDVTLTLPGETEPTTVTVEIFDGVLVFQGDIVLGEEEALLPTLGTQAVTLSGGELWEGNTVPFTISNDHNGTMRQRIKDAIAHWEANTGLRFVGRNGQGSWIEFGRVDDGCSSPVGREGGKRTIKLSNDCATGSIIHEIGHSVGLWHEQSREDRNSFVTVMWDNIIDGKDHNFEQHVKDGEDFGTYDYASIMHYSSTAFGKVDLFGDRLTTIQTTATIGQRNGLSPKDIAAINALYPPGGGAIVDLYEGNGASQNVVCSLVVGAQGFFSYDFPDLDECDNDEARSLILHDVPGGRVIRLYDSPSGATDDDWVQIRVLQPVTSYTIPTFENSFEDAFVRVTYHPDNGLDGKVSRLVVSGNAIPNVAITKPSDGTSVPYGGLNIVDFEAHADDPEDGADCCTVTWTSDRVGPLGTGTPLQYAFAEVGVHAITATATDSDGASAKDTITLTVTNSAPDATIVSPSAGENLARDIPHVFEATVHDDNEPLANLCSTATWTSSVRADPILTGCKPAATFSSNGSRTLTFTAIDSIGGRGGTASDTVTINVVDPPSTGPPVVTILAPANNDGLEAGTTVTLKGSAVDPDGELPLSYQWIAKDYFGGKTVIGTGSQLSWTPEDDVPFNCGGGPIEIVLEVTDPDLETGSDSIEVYIVYPPC